MGRGVLALGAVALLGIGVFVGYSLADRASPVAGGAGPKEQPADRLSRQDLLLRFGVLWGAQQEFFVDNHWLGVQTAQNPLDAWCTQEIISEVKPDFIVETGTYKGGSAALWSTILEQVNPEGRVLTVDIEDMAAKARELPVVQRHVDFFVGSSTDPAIFSQIAQRVQGGRVMVILDSLHTREHVLDELRLYAPLVSVGSYLIVQDTGIAFAISTEWSGAADAVKEFLAENDAFEVDRKHERFLLTANPGGYLRRVR